ncbi:MAG: ABC transporter ATP-binding protein [Candidatus Baltobacteraceae bacterium]|jgi:spermidine/putrescine transport system ATP-binding protein
MRVIPRQASKAAQHHNGFTKMNRLEDDIVIRLEGVSKRYGDKEVLHAVDLDVRRGEFLTLLGPSGCGKTTTLKMIAGFETPTTGRIVLDGVDVSETPPYKRHLNTVFQQYALFPHMSVYDNVAFGPRTTGVSRPQVHERVVATLAMVNMSDFAPKKPGQLSGGQQQRVALARALVNNPSALLLDEPLSALDVKLRRQMQFELKRIQTEVQTTFIFVTHDQDEALTMSTRIAVMNEGRIDMLGAPEEIYKRPNTPFVAGFIGSANLIPARVSGQGAGEVRLELEGGGGGAAASPAGLPLGARVLLMLRPEQISLTAEAGSACSGGSFSARLASVDFQGSIFRYALRRDDGREVVVTLLPQYQLTGVAPGDQLTVRWDSAHSWVVSTD